MTEEQLILPRKKSDKAIISKESLAKFNAILKLNSVSDDDSLVQQFRSAIEEYNHPEAVEQRKLEQLEKEQAYNPLTDKFNLTVRGNFPKNTLYRTVSEALKGKVVNEWVYAAQLTDSIRSSVSMAYKSIEERAAYREMALKQAEKVITEVREMFASFDWQDGLVKLTGEVHPDYLHELMKWNEDMLNLF